MSLLTAVPRHIVHESRRKSGDKVDVAVVLACCCCGDVPFRARAAEPDSRGRQSPIVTVTSAGLTCDPGKDAGSF